MTARTIHTPGGFVLLPVVIALVLLAAIAMLISQDGATGVEVVAGHRQAEQADKMAQAGLAHAQWHIRGNACTGDATIAVTALGNGSYSATVDAAATTTSTQTFSTNRDAFIKEASPDDNFGSDAELSVKNKVGDNFRSLHHFDLSSISPGTRVTSATLWVYLTSNDPDRPVDIHPVTAAWTEAGATWNTVAANLDSQVFGSVAPQPSANVSVPVNLSALTQSWTNDAGNNFGITLIANSTDIESKYASKEYGTAGLRPYLQVVTANAEVSPVSVQATGTMQNGVTRTLSRNAVPVHQPRSQHVSHPDGSAGKDTYLYMWKPGWNYGADGELWVDSRWADSIAKSLLEFDLGGIPKGARVASANLDLYQLNSSLNGGPVGVHRVTNTWEEGTQSGGSGTGGNWTERDVDTAWTVAGGDHDAAPIMTTIVPAATGWVSWDIAELMNGWVAGTHQNFGLVLTPETPGTAAHFHSSDSSNAALRPKLTITYACECGMACLAPQGSGNVLMVVQDKTSPDSHEISQQSLLESWGYSVNLISDDDPQATYDSAFGGNDVVYMTGSAIVTQVGTKLSNAPIGVVNNNGQLNDELGISSTRGRPIGTGIDVTDNSHYITTPFAAGALPVYTAAMKGLTATGTLAPGLQTLAQWGGATSLAVLDQGATQVGGGPSPARRVVLPFGRAEGSNQDWRHVNSNGHLIVQRAIAWASGLTASPVDTITLSTDSAATLGGLSFADVDLAEYDPGTGTANLYFEGGLTTLNVDITAVHVLTNGHLVLAAKGNPDATLGGVTFQAGDLVDYDPVADSATLIFDGNARFTDPSEKITSVHVLDNGHLILSTDSPANLGGLSFTDIDLVEYDPLTDTASLFFDGSPTTLNVDITAVHVLTNGHLVLAAKGNPDATLGGG